MMSKETMMGGLGSGPAPKRSTEVRRTNSRESKGKTPLVIAKLGPVNIPSAGEDWHDFANDLYVGLEDSGQSWFYAQSDWDLAWLACEQISRLLKPRFIGWEDRWNREAQAMERKARFAAEPIKGGEFSALMKAFTDLLMTEASRRRVGIELVHEATTGLALVPASVTAIDHAKTLLGAT